MVIWTSLQACGVVLPFAISTSTCRSSVTICSGLYLLIGMTGLPPQVNSLSLHLVLKTPVRSYALCEGLALGGISALFEQAYPGIAIQSMGLTFGVTAVMLVLYTSGVLRATHKFTVGVIAATGGIFLVYMVDIILGFFGKQVPLLNS